MNKTYLYLYSLDTPRRSLFLNIPQISNYRNPLGVAGVGGEDTVAQFIEALVEIAGSIPDGVNGIFKEINLPAALWPRGADSELGIFPGG
jgi:hypothetical protein